MTERRWWQLDPTGALLGFVLAALSVTPSLLPRSALLQALLAAVNLGVGYALGAALGWLLGRFVPWRPNSRWRRWWRWGAIAAVVVAAAVLSSLSLGWQNQVRQVVGLAPLPGTDWLSFLGVFLPTTVLLLAAGRGIRRLMSWMRARLGPWPGTLTGLLSTLVIIAVLLGGALGLIDRIYLDRNGHPDASLAQPTSTLRSGGPGSLVAWNTVGRHGSTFLAGGPTAAEIEAVTGQPALEPIRVYAGLDSAADTAARAALVVSELQRTGAFGRKVLVVATATGSGWLEPQAVDSLEYLQGGDTAIASMQYAYTPSWVSFLFDQQAAVTAGSALFNAVYAVWSQLPADQRPELVSYGLSLGALGSQGTFTDLAELRAKTSGALFVGSPYNAQLWQTLTAERDPGSPVWLPVLGDGAVVRWYSNPQSAAALPADWQHPRVLYLQHANDPVTWLSTNLIWQAPEWLTGPRSPAVSNSMIWLPLITAEQVTVDMFSNESMPAGTGHNYGDVMLSGWQSVTGNGVLDAAAAAKVQAIIEAYAQVSSVDD